MKTFLSVLIFIVFVQPAFSTRYFRGRFHGRSSPAAVFNEPQLHAAVRFRDIELFHQLLPLQEDVNFRNSREQSPLGLAAALSEQTMTRALLEKGARLDMNHPVDQKVFKYALPPVKKILKEYQKPQGFCRRLFKR